VDARDHTGVPRRSGLGIRHQVQFANGYRTSERQSSLTVFLALVYRSHYNTHLRAQRPSHDKVPGLSRGLNGG